MLAVICCLALKPSAYSARGKTTRKKLWGKRYRDNAITLFLPFQSAYPADTAAFFPGKRRKAFCSFGECRPALRQAHSSCSVKKRKESVRRAKPVRVPGEVVEHFAEQESTLEQDTSAHC
uniref:Uncharacterized protein n=1 Tax=Rhodosorus marinus TaxID=101924 RepID=A0A7S3EBH1_9RHOD|mmetsp:Transcript_23583/g.93238  ORF Transcript_23583/g.93238 Transcript_23583/m.93238 type:complete len:120 (+) Transcript_23583:69-428(+)